MSKIHLQVKSFDDVTSGDPAEQCNKFLEEMADRVDKVTALYNTILGGVVYVVTYWA